MWQGPLDSSSFKDTLSNHYKVLRDIGQGSFAQVKLAHHVLTRTDVAMKAKDKTEVSPNVITLSHIIKNIYLAMELLYHIPEASGLQEEPRESSRRSCAQYPPTMRCALSRDMKAENILEDVR